MKNRKIYPYIIAIVVIGLLVWLAISIFSKNKNIPNNARTRQAKPVDAYVVKTQELTNSINLAGTLLAYDEVELKNEVAGRIVELNLPEGQLVKEGTLLVKLYNDDLIANLDKLNAQLETKEQIYERQLELYKLDGISKNELDQSKLEVDVLKSEIAMLGAQIRKTIILAPFDGVVGLRNVSLGAIVNTSSVLASLRSTNKLKLDFFIPERYAYLIEKGMKVKFSIFGSDEEFDASVIASDGGIEQGTRELKVRALVESKNEKLVPGVFANITLELGTNNQAIMLPTHCIIPKEQTKSVIVANNGKAEFRTVNTGIRQAENIEITSGISEGDTVIITGILFLREGAEIVYANITDTL